MNVYVQTARRRARVTGNSQILQLAGRKMLKLLEPEEVMPVAPGTLSWEIQNWVDDTYGKTTSLKLHGRLVSETAGEFKELVKPMIAAGGRIIIDFADVTYVDSSGLGAMVGLKVSALNQGLCRLTTINLSQRIKDLLSLANLSQLFSS